VFCRTSGDTLPPSPEATGLEFLPHQFYHFSFLQAGAIPDFFEGNAVGPSQSHNLVFFVNRHG
jgi:hypothetical protein|tara:strand:- start:8781 stop:8969 length:189 start_codon:yes stop_codon:yes gene_type:complete